ncbi:MAG: HAD hydrolase-like protein [Clostridiales bacterium]|jgi:phosphoglycolate phosphatase|nr:HAD hydrolase-like protein [Clostridiales bacterium]
MMYNQVIWDFNGTIYNDVDIGIESVNTLLLKRGLKTINSLDEYRYIFRFPIRDYYEDLGFDLEYEGYENIAVEWVREYLKNEEHAGLFEGIETLLSDIKFSGRKQYLLSTTEKGMLVNQLKRLNIFGLFDEIIGTGDIYAHSKIQAARHWSEGRCLDDALLIGDTYHDFETAEALGVSFAAVTYGHGAKNSFNPNTVFFGNVDEIRGYLKI